VEQGSKRCAPLKRFVRRQGETLAIFGFLLYSAFCYWVAFKDGADVIEGWKSFFAFGWLAPVLNAQQLRFYAGVSWVASLVVLLFNVFGAT